MRSSVFLFGSILAALSLTAGAARAGDQEYPVSFVERPLTLPRLTLAPQAELDFSRLTVDGVPGGVSLVAGLQIGASFGITNNLEVGAIVLPIQFNGGAGYGGYFQGDETVGEPQVYGTFRFLHREALDLGVRLRIILEPGGRGLGAGAVFEPSLPLLVHLGKLARLDVEVGLPIVLASSTTTTDGGTTVTVGGSHVGLDVPVRLAFDIIEPLHVGVSTGLRVDDFGHGGDTTAIPLGIFAGYAIGEKRPIVDIDPFFSFFNFLTPGVGDGADKVNPGQVVFGVNARGYIYF